VLSGDNNKVLFTTFKTIASSYRGDAARGSRGGRVRSLRGDVARNSRLDTTLYF